MLPIPSTPLHPDIPFIHHTHLFPSPHNYTSTFDLKRTCCFHIRVVAFKTLVIGRRFASRPLKTFPFQPPTGMSVNQGSEILQWT